MHLAFQVDQALERYQRALARDSHHYAALWHAAAQSVVVGLLEDDPDRAVARFEAAEAYARRAIEAKASGAEAWGWLAVALGQQALHAGLRDRVQLAEEIRAAALEALARDPDSPLGHHVLGQWHAEVRRVGGVQRMIARALLGGRSFSEASWEDAEHHLARSVELEPESILHRIELARVYAETGRPELARDMFEAVLAAPLRDPTDPDQRGRARALLEELPPREAR